MSRGLGAVERGIIAAIKAYPGESLTMKELSRYVFNTEKPTASQLSSIGRAARLLRNSGWIDQYFVSERGWHARYKSPFGKPQKEETVTQEKKIVVDAPKKMGLTERRIIFEKLNEVYLDEKRGYGDGWSDATLASDLGVPRAWIAEIRDQNFGPDKNEMQDELLIKLETALNMCDAKIGEVKLLLSDLTKIGNETKDKISLLSRTKR